MKNLDLIIQNANKINEIMQQHKVKEWKVFGKAVGQKFPQTGDIHFLLIPEEKGFDHKSYMDLTLKIDKLFKTATIAYYTHESLELEVNNETLEARLAESATKNALNLKQLEKLWHQQKYTNSNLSENNAGYKPLFQQQELNNKEQNTNANRKEVLFEDEKIAALVAKLLIETTEGKISSQSGFVAKN